MYSVVLLPQAEKTFTQADATLAKKLAKGFELLEADPFRHRNIKRLTGPLKGLFRLRVGDYRIVFQVDSKTKMVYVVWIGHRKDSYQ